MPMNKGFIDVHHHLVPPAWISERHDAIAASIRRVSLLTDWSPSRSVEEMDKNGIATAVTSLTHPGVWCGDKSKAQMLARACNEYAIQMGRDFPGRFGVFAALPLPDVEGSLQEIAYAFDVLKADGVGLMTNFDDKWPGEPGFAEVFDELNRRKAVVYFHPTVARCCSELIPGVSPSVLEFPFDTTRAIVSLLVNGTFARCRDIKWIFSHAGGALPILANRIDGVLGSMPSVRSSAPEGILSEFRQLYFDTALATDHEAISALIALTEKSHILFGSDYPLVDMDKCRAQYSKLQLPTADLIAIGRENALRLFPQLN